MRVPVIALLLLLAVLATALHEMPIKHHKRSPREAQLLLEYMNRGPLAEKITKILRKIFPSELTPNIYAYPEVKIINYLDAQYYGYFPFNLVKFKSVILLKPSPSSSTLAHPTCGCLPRNANCPPPATSTNTSTLPRAPPMSRTDLISTSPTAQALSLALSVKTPPGSLVFLPRTHFSLRSPNSTVSVSLLPSSTVSWAWPGLQFQSTDCPSSSTCWSTKAKCKVTLSLST